MTTEKPAAGATGPARKTRRRATSARPARRAAGARSAARHARCAQCSRPLTDPESVRLGYGPDCAVKLGLVAKPKPPPRKPLSMRRRRMPRRMVKDDKQLELSFE